MDPCITELGKVPVDPAAQPIGAMFSCSVPGWFWLGFVPAMKGTRCRSPVGELVSERTREPVACQLPLASMPAMVRISRL